MFIFTSGLRATKQFKYVPWELNVWRFEFAIITSPMSMGSMIVRFGFFKLIRNPKEGMMISKEDYKGFMFRKEYFLKDVINIQYNFKNKKYANTKTISKYNGPINRVGGVDYGYYIRRMDDIARDVSDHLGK